MPRRRQPPPKDNGEDDSAYETAQEYSNVIAAQSSAMAKALKKRDQRRKVIAAKYDQEMDRVKKRIQVRAKEVAKNLIRKQDRLLKAWTEANARKTTVEGKIEGVLADLTRECVEFIAGINAVVEAREKMAKSTQKE